MNKLLPVGTLIKVNNKSEKYLIIGKRITKLENDIYDYMCVPYPYGYVENVECLFFNDEDVVSYIYLGNMNY
ncbi:MAG: DUF4176 domain-containing protein [Bacilli bacterium]|nr:DUF4176 domain-containing protein [Bacilli bacterium]